MAIRGGFKTARNSAIGCACLLAVIEGVGIAFQRMMAENTKHEVCQGVVYKGTSLSEAILIQYSIYSFRLLRRLPKLERPDFPPWHEPD